MDNIEVWKHIEGYEGLYQVSNLGRVKSLRFDKEKILKPADNGNGYLKIGLYKNDKQKYYSVHRLVANAFIPNPNNLQQINHKDENKTNNCVDNLEWCTQEYNNNYGTRKSKTMLAIIQLSLNDEFVRCYRSFMDAGKAGFNIGNVNSCCKGRCKTSNGFKWLYATDYDGLYEIPLF